MEELELLEHYKRLKRLWWVLVAAAIVGALAGYVFHTLRPAVYEATATIYATLDPRQIPNPPLPEQYTYNEDLALDVVRAAVVSPDTRQAVVNQAAAQGIQLDPGLLLVEGAYERQHGFWFVHYRSTDPHTAQVVTNLWMSAAYQTLLNWQSAGKVYPFVQINPPTLADLPVKPTAYQRNALVLAGALLGLIAGIFISNGFTARLLPAKAR